MPRDERPYEKCSRLGAEHLSDVELLAVLLRTGTRGENALELAGRILYHAGGIGILGIHQFNAERLKQIKGIGNVKAIQISCISELAKRLAKASYQDTVCFTDPKTIAQYYMEDLRHEKQEHMNASLVTPRELFIEALQKNAVSIIILHNHPSGDPSPSREDMLTTKRIQDAGALIGIELLDHIIIGNNCYISFREEGML